MGVGNNPLRLHCLQFHPGTNSPAADANGVMGAQLHDRLGAAEAVFAPAAMQDSLCNSNLFQESQG